MELAKVGSLVDCCIGIVVVEEIMGGFWKLRSNNSWRKNVSFLMSVGLLLLFLCQLSLATVHHQRISGMVSTPLPLFHPSFWFHNCRDFENYVFFIHVWRFGLWSLLAWTKSLKTLPYNYFVISFLSSLKVKSKISFEGGFTIPWWDIKHVQEVRVMFWKIIL